MFDYHMHTRVSFDGHYTGFQMAQAAKAAAPPLIWHAASR